MNILYIEDNPRDRILVERYIQTTRHHLVVAASLDDVDLNAADFDLILLDIYLGGKATGIDYLQQIRERGIECPVMAVTALTLPYQIAFYRQAGIDRILEKPFEITKLAELIAHYEK